VPREEPPPARRQGGEHDDPYGPRGREQHVDDHFDDPVPRGPVARDQPRHDTYDGYGYGDDYQHERGDAAYATDATYGHDATRGGGGQSPLATGWLPLWPTVGIALAAVILAFIIGHVTAGGGSSNTVATGTVTTEASTTTMSAAATTHVVARGETLSAIASQYHVDPAALATYNGITNPSHIFVGQVINIPPASP
jgi:LysM repeat protein